MNLRTIALFVDVNRACPLSTESLATQDSVLIEAIEENLS